MTTRTDALSEAARTALGSACSQVTEPEPVDDVDRIHPAVVAHPGSTEEVAEVMRVCCDQELAVVARGRGTKMTWGLPPERIDVLLDLSGMGQVLDHAAGDLIVETQAGTRLSDVQQSVAAARQRLALDETVPGASVGGTLATGTSGPGRMATGTLRDLLIGVTVVRADGVVAKAGGRVVKNVAGYDLGKLVHGSFGTLAVVTEAVFRLHPLPAARRWVTVGVDGPAQIHEAVQSLVHSQVVPSAVEVDVPVDGAGDGSATVGVLLEGIAAGVDGRTATVLELLGSSAQASQEPPAGWGAYPWDVTARGDDRAIAVKLTFALSGLTPVLEAARAAATDVHLRGSAGVGVVYGALPPGTDPTAVAGAVEALRRVCLRYGGSLVVLDGPAAVKTAVDTWGPVPALELMRRVKDQFDPDRRLAPGRFVGGI
jgi:glycolate oxidase FAD binding subunit